MRRRFVLFILIYFVCNLYIGWNGLALLRAFGASTAGRTAFALLLTIIALSYLLARSLRISGRVGWPFKIIGSYYFALFEFSMLLLPILDAVAAILYWTGHRPSAYCELFGILYVAVMAVLFGLGSWYARSPVIRTYEFEIDKPAGERGELRIAAASDLHLGTLVRLRHLNRLIRIMRELQPDLILFAGDVLDDELAPFVDQGMPERMGLLRAPLGIYAVLGNHEYYGGDIEEYVNVMQKVGIRVLRDECVRLDGGIQLAGRKDKAAESMDPAKRLPIGDLLGGLDNRSPILVMDHQPYGFDRAAEAGADLLLCGHTHRGQFAPNHWFTRRMFELDWGWMRKGALHIVVSSGFGTWGPPIRLASRSEIVQIRIRFRSNEVMDPK